jgi:transcriptional repressor NrdR
VRCPQCGERDTRVVDSRDIDDAAIRRRRECNLCSTRFTTYERIEAARLTVVKSNGRREEFDREKLASGLAKALTRRPVEANAAQQAAEEIETALRARGSSEIPSGLIGEMAMEKLREIDQIAYIRFASVYQSFEDIEQLRREVDSLLAEREEIEAETNGHGGSVGSAGGKRYPKR